VQDTKPNAKAQSGLYPVPAVGVVCWRGDEVLLIRRGSAPRQGEWSIPGGKVMRGEALHEAALRELSEETNVLAKLGDQLAVYEIIEPDFHYVLIDYAAVWVSGEAKAGDDADEALFVKLDQAMSLVNKPDLCDVLQRAFVWKQGLSG
jgi:8-oxo-dGTP diphosphatase